MGDIGKIAYDAYKEMIDNMHPITEIELASWDNLSVEIQEAWNAAARKVLEFMK